MESRKTLLSFRLFHLSFNSSRLSRRQRIVGAPVEAHSAGADGQVPEAVLRQNALGHVGAHAHTAENDVALGSSSPCPAIYSFSRIISPFSGSPAFRTAIHDKRRMELRSTS